MPTPPPLEKRESLVTFALFVTHRPPCNPNSTNIQPAHSINSCCPCNQRSTRAITRARLVAKCPLFIVSAPLVCPRPQPLPTHPLAYSTRHVILPLDTAVVMPLARSLVSPVTTASGRKVACRVACPEPTTAMRAETVAVPVQHTIDALVADQPLSRFQSPGRCPALFAGV